MLENKTGSLSRRRFFRIGVGGTIALGLGAGAFAWWRTGYEVPEAVAGSLENLSEKEYRILQAIAGRILRADGPDLPSAEDVGAALYVDGLLSNVHEEDRTGLKRLLILIEHGLPLSESRLGRFTRLEGEAQDAVLTAMMSSKLKLLRGGFEALRTLCVMAFYRDTRTWAAIGYDGPLVGRPEGGWGGGAP